VIEIRIPVRTVSEANRASHEHWAVRHRRAKHQKTVAYCVAVARVQAFRTGLRGRKRLRAGALVVHLTRVAARELDTDNLWGSQKHVRDGIAAALAIDDRDPRVEWRYAQTRGEPGEQAVIARFEWADSN
jgi:hypothetical protein